MSRGRLHDEPPPGRRTAFQRDRDRIIHATAFRRLMGKTQVFLTDEGDHYRTRLTHTIEVAQIARSIARALRIDEDLTEAVALAHDLGHPPFGHAGERALDAAMAGNGGFDHNGQSLRVVTRLERRYPGFDGLNLAWETLEGLVKHNGPLTTRDGTPLAGRLVRQVAVHAAEQDLWLWSQPSVEAQVAAIADDIAYDTHDIDDGVRAGLLDLDEFRANPLTAAILDAIDREHPALDPMRRRHELGRRLIGSLIEDVLAETGRRVADTGVATADGVRRAGRAVVGFSPDVAAREAELKALLRERVYRHPRVMSVMQPAERMVGALFARYRDEPGALPPEWRAGTESGDEERRLRCIADFLAGMTDRFAVAEFTRLFDRPPDFG